MERFLAVPCILIVNTWWPVVVWEYVFYDCWCSQRFTDRVGRSSQMQRLWSAVVMDLTTTALLSGEMEPKEDFCHCPGLLGEGRDHAETLKA